MSRLEIVEVFSGVWSVRRGKDGSAAYILKTSPGCLLIDSGSERAATDVMLALQKARVGLRSVRAILLTHHHAHAAAGAETLRERSGAPVLSSPLDALGPLSVEPDRSLTAGDRVENRIEVVPTPGHTSGHLSFYFPRARVLFAGDAVTVADENVGPAPDAADELEARASFARCLALGAELLLPAHGRPVTPATASRELRGTRGS